LVTARRIQLDRELVHIGGPDLVSTRDEIRAFVLGAKAGEFDDLT
jgi:hypothetical protein